MEDSHKSNTPETAPQPGSTVQGTHISQIAHQSYSYPNKSRFNNLQVTGF
ncbi:Atf1 [Phodopus roborovskii]|uniref:Atf1 protein n=1 Tax=Phodopus roborovskii TaxID=109678 RepID=A0AAU9ZID5_PHORO|nr:Atf1 [Phodopus roborovskii]